MNKVVLVGEIVKSPVVKKSKTDKSYIISTIKTVRTYKDTEFKAFIPFIGWGNSVEILKELVCGDKVAIEGSIDYNVDEEKLFVSIKEAFVVSHNMNLNTDIKENPNQDNIPF